MRKIIYIAGMGRSGSTVLARLLGEVDGSLNIGEGTRYLFNQNMFEQNLPCGCGRQPADCPFWGDLLPGLSAQARLRATALLRLRSMGWVLPKTGTPDGFDEMLESVDTMYESVAGKAGATVIVDSSKHPAIGHLLSRLPGFELHTVHLVRDPRAIVSSRSTSKAYLRPMTPGVVVRRWLALNAAAETLRTAGASYQRIAYEDFARAPADCLNTIHQRATGEAPVLDFLDGNVATIGSQHPLAGNPDKLTGGPVTIRPAIWTLPTGQQRMVTSTTLPMLLRYGYPLGGGSTG